MQGGEWFPAHSQGKKTMLEILKDNGFYGYCPELGQKAVTGCVFEAHLAWDGRHYWVESLNGQTIRGRGIEDHGNGEYLVTRRAFAKLKKEYPIRWKEYLD